MYVTECNSLPNGDTYQESDLNKHVTKYTFPVTQFSHCHSIVFFPIYIIVILFYIVLRHYVSHKKFSSCDGCYSDSMPIEDMREPMLDNHWHCTLHGTKHCESIRVCMCVYLYIYLYMYLSKEEVASLSFFIPSRTLEESACVNDKRISYRRVIARWWRHSRNFRHRSTES